jgi:putative DNA primase/helicase
VNEPAEQYEVYRQNALPGMVEVLAERLGVSATALHAIGIGWKIDENAWIFPERDETGKIIGLVRRFHDGKKLSSKGHSRGLTFAPATVADGYSAHNQRWRRVTEHEPCPICDKPDWCGVDGNAGSPRFVRCMRVREGSLHECVSGGYIHELVPGSFRPPARPGAVLPDSPWPVLIVEGASDAAAAIDLGFVAVGKPSAEGGNALMEPLVAGRSVAVLGENDAGAGKAGMERTASLLAARCPKVVCVMPPEGVKDLRAWVHRGLTAEELLKAIDEGDTPEDGPILEDISPVALASLWLRSERWERGRPTLRKWEGDWYVYTSPGYEKIRLDVGLRQPLYKFLSGRRYKRITSKGAAIEDYVLTRSKLDDIIDALIMECPVTVEPPCWLDGRENPDPKGLILFQNGVLNTEEYLRGKPGLMKPDPSLFHLSSIPYEWQPHAPCPRWVRFLGEVFQDDSERIDLLQEWFGYNMVADNSMEKMMLFIGRPGSGKSTSLDVLRMLLGKGQCARSSFKDLCSEFGRQPLVGKLSILLPDAHIPRSADAVQALETIKSIVGRDGITVNRKFLEQLPEVRLSGRFTIAVNELPELPDHAQSLARRLLLLHFPETFTGREDRTLKDKLYGEAPGVAVWALEGLRRLRARGKFTEPKSSLPVVEEFKRLMTPVAEFLDECCTLNRVGYVPCAQLYDVWLAWARAKGCRPGARTTFIQRVLSQNADLFVDRVSLQGERVRCMSGVELSAEGQNYLRRAI